jgi:hypothetical protein
MEEEALNEQDEILQKALSELQELIQQHYPQASFTVSQGDDPEGVYLRVVVDVADTDEVVDTFIDRLLYFQIEERLPIFVVPVQPLARVVEATKAQRTRLASHGGEHRSSVF